MFNDINFYSIFYFSIFSIVIYLLLLKLVIAVIKLVYFIYKSRIVWNTQGLEKIEGIRVTPFKTPVISFNGLIIFIILLLISVVLSQYHVAQNEILFFKKSPFLLLAVTFLADMTVSIINKRTSNLREILINDKILVFKSLFYKPIEIKQIVSITETKPLWTKVP